MLLHAWILTTFHFKPVDHPHVATAHASSRQPARQTPQRSNSLSRIFTAFSSTSIRQSSLLLSRSSHAHPLARTPESIDQLSPKRPSILNMVKVKSDPCIDLHRIECDSPHKSHSERRCEQGFIVNAETSLRDVL